MKPEVAEVTETLVLLGFTFVVFPLSQYGGLRYFGRRPRYVFLLKQGKAGRTTKLLLSLYVLGVACALGCIPIYFKASKPVAITILQDASTLVPNSFLVLLSLYL